MLTEKLIAIGCDDTTSISIVLDKLKQTSAFSYNVISATMAAGLTGLLRSLKPDLIILCFRNNQQVLTELANVTVQLEIPILCLTRRFECETLDWNKNHVVFTCMLEYIHKASYLISRINSIFLLKQQEIIPQQTAAFSTMVIADPDNTRNLSRYVMELDQKAEVLLKIKVRICELYPRVDDATRTELTSIVNSIRMSANDHKLWDDFKLYFEQTNPHFLLLLARKYPSLTATDLKYCCYLKMNMSNADIMNLLGINLESVRTHKYRLKKKMALSRDQELISHLRSINQEMPYTV